MTDLMRGQVIMSKSGFFSFLSLKLQRKEVLIMDDGAEKVVNKHADRG